MVIFIATLIYIAVVGLCIFLVQKIYSFRKQIKKHNEFIKNFDNKVYKELRIAQFKAYEISKQAQRFQKDKNSIIGEILSTFKKIKSLIFLRKLSKKIV